MPMRRLPLILIAAAALAGCGGPDGPAITDADRETGAKHHPQLLAEFGGAYDGDEAAYVKELGERLAAAAGLAGQCTFALVNSDVVNAFAVPGCYIYVTRGLMGIVNSEAELGAVLGHEIGHIVGRHAQRQERRSLWRRLGVAAVGMLTGSERLTRLAGAAAGLFTLRYSRSQEYEADDLGLGYVKDAGLDPYESADMLEALGRHEQYLARTRGVDEARSIPEWARTHPLSTARVERAQSAAKGSGTADGALPEHADRFADVVDGMLFGDDPEQGFVMGRAFAHPRMRIAFEAPPGFTLTNSPQAILIEGPGGMRGEFAGGPMPAVGAAAYTEAALQQLLRGADVEITDNRPVRVNGVDALVTQATAVAGQQRVELAIVVYDAGATAYHFVMVTGDSSARQGLDALFSSFRLLSEDEARQLRPRVIETVRVGAGDTVESLGARMAGGGGAAQFRMLNGLEDGETLRRGQPVKIVVYAEQ